MCFDASGSRIWKSRTASRRNTSGWDKHRGKLANDMRNWLRTETSTDVGGKDWFGVRVAWECES